jgi:hypothetical protein
VATKRRSFSLDPEEDAELIDWLDGRRNASATVREALWAYYRAEQGDGASLDNVLSEVRALSQKLDRIKVVRGDDGPDEDPELAAALDGLGI